MNRIKTLALVVPVLLLSGALVVLSVGGRAGETKYDAGRSQGAPTAHASLSLPALTPASSSVGDGGGGAGGASTTVSSGDWAIAASPAPFNSWRYALALSESIRISGGDGGGEAQTTAVDKQTTGVKSSSVPASTTITSSVEQAEVAPQAWSTAQPTMTHAPAVAKSGDAADVTVGGTQSTEGSNPSRGGTPTTRVEASSLAPYAVLRDWIATSRWPVALHARVEALVLCESKGSTTAVSDGGHVGLLQVDPKLHGPVPADAVGQLNQGFAVYQKQGFAAWSCA